MAAPDPEDPDWERLPHDPAGFFGLPADFDRRALRRAYGALARRFHPDRDPERFMALRAAFEELLERLESGLPVPPPAPTPPPAVAPLLALLEQDIRGPDAPLCGPEPTTLEQRLVRALRESEPDRDTARLLGRVNRLHGDTPSLVRAFTEQRQLPERDHYRCLRPLLIELVRRGEADALLELLGDLSRSPKGSDQRLGLAAVEWVLPAAALHLPPAACDALDELAMELPDPYESHAVLLAEAARELLPGDPQPRTEIERRALEALRETWLGEWADEAGGVARLFESIEADPAPLLELEPADPRALALCHLLELYCGTGPTAGERQAKPLGPRLEALFTQLDARANANLAGFLWNDGTAMLLLPGLLSGPLLLAAPFAWARHAGYGLAAWLLVPVALVLSILLLFLAMLITERLFGGRVYLQRLRPVLLELAAASPLDIDELIALAAERDLSPLHSSAVLDRARSDPALRLAYLASRHAP